MGTTGSNWGGSARGYPHRCLQRLLLNLYRRGILLAICSKNDHDDAWRVLESHPDMLLRPDHFAAIRINWADKAENLRAIAAELNIGLDSLAFLDDNPRERHLVRMHAPGVTVLEVSEDPGSLADAVRRCPRFQRLRVTPDDRQRGLVYRQQQLRHAAQQRAVDLPTYLASLQTRIRRVRIAGPTLHRVAELTQKTNQFNVTSRRYQSQDIDAFLRSTSHEVYAFHVTDRFGDNGVVGVAIMEYEKTDGRLDTFLLSCRVIGRSVETAMLAWICADAVRRGCLRLVGTLVATPQNSPCRDFFEKHGFAKQGNPDMWTLDLNEAIVEEPKWIKRVDDL